MNEELLKAIIYLLVGISVLLTGMKLMSGGLRKATGSGLKRFFRKTQDNPIISLLIGLIVTALIQASDATNAMIVGFINAGVMTISQGLNIMLGAYIGTTVTGVLASFSSLSISLYLLLFAFIGTVMMFFNSEKVKNIGEILCGLGLLFFGLAVMKSSFQNEDISEFCRNVFQQVDNGILLFLIGFVIAALIQSSSAVTAIVISMVGGGALTLSSGLYIALGATLGTVVNTLLVSIGGNINGKRAAIIAFTLRAITSVIMLAILMIFESPLCEFFNLFAINGSKEFSIAMFTVVYNVVFMPLLIPFIKPVTKLFERLIKDKDTDELAKTIHYIDDKLLVYPDIAVMQVKKEIINMYDLAFQNYKNAFDKIIKGNNKKDKEIVALEDKVDYLNKRITNFLIELSNKAQSKDEKKVGGYFHVINDIERIGDHAYNFYEMANEMASEGHKFSDAAIEEIKQLNSIIVPMFTLARTIFITKNQEELPKLHSYENKTDELKNVFYSNHYDRIKNNICKNELTPFISSFITDYERIADHLTNIAYSVQNPTGDDDN